MTLYSLYTLLCLPAYLNVPLVGDDWSMGEHFFLVFSMH